jgi:gamma-glutamylcysteine synthetase
MPLADDQNMIQALTPKRSDQAFSVWVLHAGSRTLEKFENEWNRSLAPVFKEYAY